MRDKDKLIWFYKEYIKNKIKTIGCLILLIFIGTAFANISPFLYGKMLDAITKGDLRSLQMFIVVYFVINVVTGLLSIAEGAVGKLLDFNLSKRVQKVVFDRIVRMRVEIYKRYETGELISRLNGDSQAVIGFYINVISGILQIIVNMIISIYFVMTISLRLSTVALFYIPSTYLLIYLIRKYYKKLAEREKRFGDKYYSFLTQIFSNNKGIKSFNLEGLMSGKYHGYIDQQRSMLKYGIKISSINQIVGEMVTVISSLFIVYLSAILIKNGLLTIGLMVAFNTYINKLFRSISQIFNLNLSFQSVSVSLNRLFKIHHEELEEHDFQHVEIPGHNIAISNLVFRYDKNEEYVLNGLNLSIEEAGLYSIVGPNGCGKSTLAKILIKFHDAQEGDVLVDGVNLNNLGFESIREGITYVQKDDFFFNTTVMDNLKMGNPIAADWEVKEICKSVGIDKFIEVLSDGYESLMGESGELFSSGQKQKLSIARALLRQTPIYIFDELTANLDGGAEKEIMQIIQQISAEAIVIFISHNLSSIKDSKQIFVMNNGHIINQGNHQSLLKNDSVYKRLFEQEYKEEIFMEEYHEG